jgi:hypothetical protein
MDLLSVIGLSLAAVVVDFLGLFLGRTFGLSPFASVGFGLVPALLILFPVFRWWYQGKLSFSVWLLTVGSLLVTSVLIHRIVP